MILIGFQPLRINRLKHIRILEKEPEFQEYPLRGAIEGNVECRIIVEYSLEFILASQFRAELLFLIDVVLCRYPECYKQRFLSYNLRNSNNHKVVYL